MSDLRARILERVDQLEALARAATPGPWTYNPGKAWFPDADLANRLHAGGSELDEPKLQLYAKISPDEFARARLGEEFVKAGDSTGVAMLGPADDPQSMADARHVATWDPAAVLTLCTGVRELVKPHEPVEDSYFDDEGNDWLAVNCLGNHRPGECYWPCQPVRAAARMLGIDPDA